MLAGDPELSRVWYEGLEDLEQLNVDESRRFGNVMVSLARRIEYARLMEQRGLLKPADWAGLKASALELFSRSGGRFWFKENAWRLDPSLVDFTKPENEHRAARTST